MSDNIRKLPNGLIRELFRYFHLQALIQLRGVHWQWTCVVNQTARLKSNLKIVVTTNMKADNGQFDLTFCRVPSNASCFAAKCLEDLISKVTDINIEHESGDPVTAMDLSNLMEVFTNNKLTSLSVSGTQSDKLLQNRLCFALQCSLKRLRLLKMGKCAVPIALRKSAQFEHFTVTAYNDNLVAALTQIDYRICSLRLESVVCTLEQFEEVHHRNPQVWHYLRELFICPKIVHQGELNEFIFNVVGFIAWHCSHLNKFELELTTGTLPLVATLRHLTRMRNVTEIRLTRINIAELRKLTDHQRARLPPLASVTHLVLEFNCSLHPELFFEYFPPLFPNMKFAIIGSNPQDQADWDGLLKIQPSNLKRIDLKWHQ